MFVKEEKIPIVPHCATLGNLHSLVKCLHYMIVDTTIIKPPYSTDCI